MSVLQTAVSALAGVLVVGIIVGGGIYGCQMANTNYYAAYSQCIEAGGTWIPQRGTVNDALCIRGQVLSP